jgi:hypothetical protein
MLMKRLVDLMLTLVAALLLLFPIIMVSFMIGVRSLLTAIKTKRPSLSGSEKIQ